MANQYPAQATKKVNVTEAKEVKPVPFTGIARSVICYKNNNQFNNYKVVTLHIKDGVVTAKEESIPYASFEVWDQLDRKNQASILNLVTQWEDGKALSK
jgi:hypothetical protein